MLDLKKRRKALGLSQCKLALLSNVHPSDLSRIENEWAKPYPKQLARLKKVLDRLEKKANQK